MSVRIKLNLAFQELAGSEEFVEVKGATVKECLEDFVRRYPKTRDWLFDDQGTLQSLILVNSQFISNEQLDQPIADNDELWILNILEGG